MARSSRRLPLCLSTIVALFAVAACAAPIRVALDIGHTPERVGAIGARGEGEYRYNRDMVAAVDLALSDLPGVKPQVINLEGEEITLRARTDAAAAMDANILLSFHHDSVQPQFLRTVALSDGGTGYVSPARFSGFSLFVAEREGPSLALAAALGDALLAAGFSPTLHHAEAIPGEGRELLDARRGIYRFPELVVLNTAAMPAVLVECGVIVNPDDEAQIRRADYRRRFARAVSDAVMAYRDGLLDPR